MRWTSGDVPDQTGRVAVVTGASSGLGFETARVLAGRGADVVLAVRSDGRGRDAARRIVAAHPAARCETMLLDLGDLESVARFAAALAARRDGLDLLINNAGVMMPPFGRTADGFELTFGVNHLGHFALTGRLIGMLTATDGSRVVTVSSNAHWQGRLDPSDIMAERRRYRGFRAYAHSKLANLLFARELDRRLRDRGSRTLSVAAHPGWARTDLPRHLVSVRLIDWLAQSPRMGALPQLYAATAEGIEGGAYVGPGLPGGIYGFPVPVASSRASRDPALARRLWEVSVDLTGVTFDA